MSEASAKATLIRALKRFDACSIESPMTGLGIPDVNCSLGWFECKAMKRWPRGCDEKPVIFPHELMKEQKVWLYRRAKAGGLAMVVAKVSDEWFFFDGLWIKDKWGCMTRPEMRLRAEFYAKGGLDKSRLHSFLLSRVRSF